MSNNHSAYTNDHSSAVLRTHRWRTVENSAAYLKPFIKPGMTILDVGCGPGSITVDLAKLVPQGRVIGIEYVADPLDQARSLATEKGVSNIEFRVGDIHSLDFPDDHFDVVHAHQVLQHIADPVQALREMRRVAKPNGGLVAARESDSMTWFPEFSGLAAWKELTFGMIRAKGGNPSPGSYFHTWTRKAGFERSQIKCSTGSWCFSTPEERAYWGGTMVERCGSSGFAKLAVDGGYATTDQLADVAKGWQDFVDHEDGWFGMLHGEIICWA